MRSRFALALLIALPFCVLAVCLPFVSQDAFGSQLVTDASLPFTHALLPLIAFLVVLPYLYIIITRLPASRPQAKLEEVQAELDKSRKALDELESANMKIVDMASEIDATNITLRDANARLSMLSRTAGMLSAERDIDSVLQGMLHEACGVLLATHGSVYMRLSEGRLKRVGLVGSDNATDLEYGMSTGCLVTSVITSGTGQVYQSSEASPWIKQNAPDGTSMESGLCAPIIEHGSVVGAILLCNRADGNRFVQCDLELMTAISSQASVAVRNTRLIEHIGETYVSVVHSLVKTIEKNDRYTMGHSDRVAKITVAIAREMKMPERMQEIAERAASLHDIGKIGVPTDVLNKPGPLNTEELSLLSAHPTIGAEIIGGLPFLKEVATIISQHHERPDGKGYPEGLSGEDIHPVARIISVADAYDAMMTSRAYRTALDKDAVLNELHEHRGTQFDSEAVEALLKIYKKLPYSIDSYRKSA